MTNSELTLSQLATITGARGNLRQLNPAISVKLHQARLNPPEDLYHKKEWFKIPNDMKLSIIGSIGRGDMLGRRVFDPGPIG